jgi:hypothetical protein
VEGQHEVDGRQWPGGRGPNGTKVKFSKKKQEKRKRRRCMQDHPLPWVHQCTGTGGSTGQHRSITGRSIGFRVGRSGPHSPRERRKATIGGGLVAVARSAAGAGAGPLCGAVQAVPCHADALSGVRSLLCPVRYVAAATRMPQLPPPGPAQHSALVECSCPCSCVPYERDVARGAVHGRGSRRTLSLLLSTLVAHACPALSLSHV